ncbi:MAG: ATP-binding cassette domain-containing protein [Asgard group archaeon]|nr:ATP-binding cassette domain-containing protein [Asgard group archaeon]
MIICKDLIKIYTDEETNTRIPALRGCDLKVNKGEIITIVGPSGSGKTTLINVLAGIETISSGQVVVGNYELTNLSESELNKYRYSMIGIVDQFPERTLFLDGSVEDNLKFTSSLKAPGKEEYLVDHDKILERLGILHLKNRQVRHLSGGEMIRTAIASALAKNVPVLLCDEPTGQLDSVNTERVKELLRQITRDFGVTVLVVTHDPRFQEGVDKTCEIRDGRVSTILGVEEQLAYSGRTSFQIKFKSQIDTTGSIRLPDFVLEMLKLETDVDLEVSEKGEVKLIHPKGLKPEIIKLEDIKERRKVLKVEDIPKKYFKKAKVAVQLNNVSKIYTSNSIEVQALQDINLTIKEGELVFILGPSGSGKTTLVKLLTGLEGITSGDISVLEKPFSNITDSARSDFRREQIGLVSQQGNLHPFLTIDENFYLKDVFAGKWIRKDTSYDEKIIEQLKRFNIEHRQFSYPLEISGGELQRASLAIANNDYPPIIVLDEPTANLDSELAEQAIKEIYALHESSNITFIIATHDINLIKDGIRAIELVDGKINRDGLTIS